MNHFIKKCLQLVFCLDSVAGKLCYFCHGHGRELGKLRKGVSLCIYPLQRSKESWVPSQCCFPLLASLGQVLLLLFLFLVLLVAVAHGSWCVWTAAREPYQLDAETDSSDQEGGRKVLWLSRCPMLHLQRRSEIPASLTSLSLLRRPASYVKQHQSPLGQSGQSGQQAFLNSLLKANSVFRTYLVTQ